MNNDAATQAGDNIRVGTENCTPTRPPFKIERALYSILSNGDTGITQPEAYLFYGESCLHSTISTLKNRMGICFIAFRDLDSVRHYNQTPFNRYWLSTDVDRRKAEELLNRYREKRRLPKMHFAPWHDSNKKSA